MTYANHTSIQRSLRARFIHAVIVHTRELPIPQYSTSCVMLATGALITKKKEGKGGGGGGGGDS